MSRSKEYKGQAVVLEGSKSGESLPVFKMAYTSVGDIEYFGEAKYETSELKRKWFIEKVEYDVNYNVIARKTAINKIYSGAGTVTIDVDTNDPLITLTINAEISQISVNDDIWLTIASESVDVSGIITEISGNVMKVNVQGQTGIVNKTGIAVGATDCIFQLNHPDTKDFAKRVWNLRELYIYE